IGGRRAPALASTLHRGRRCREGSGAGRRPRGGVPETTTAGRQGAVGCAMTSSWPDLDALRADTPGTRHGVHLNNAGAALMPLPVLRAVHEHLDREAEIGGYEAADERQDAVERARADVARLVGAPSPAHVALNEHATAAFTAALSSVPFRAGDTLVTTRNDYASN